ncbi:MAG: THUMP domain-containing protein [archaeon]
MIIVRHGEIFTKSEPVRKEFVRILAGNIREALPRASVRAERWRIFVESENESRDARVLQRVFGVVSVSIAEKVPCDLNSIKKVCLKIIPRKAKSFGVKTQRITKEFPLTSQEISAEIGSFIIEKKKLKVDLSNPDFWIRIEVYKNNAFIFSESLEGPGGLPVGSARGFIECDYESDEDALAAWMMLKRGACVTPDKRLASWSYGNSAGIPLARVAGITSISRFCKAQKESRLPLFAPLIGLSVKEKRFLAGKVF